MKMYEVFRRTGHGLGPVWMKGEDNLEIAKLEALRFAATNDGDYFVVDLATLKVMFETERVTRRPRKRSLRF
jgi:hypothetical protein